uniref:X-ray repair cross-complementing protein 5 n=1 Tax=Eptatretus burgeri TaxID=7764 RepID=A0A8C4R5A7_EPTBU
MGHGSLQEESHIELAKKVITLFVQRKVFAESKDEVALVLFGCEETRNLLAEEGDGYRHVVVQQPLQLADFALLEYVQSLRSSTLQADFLDALVVSMDVLQRSSGKKFEKMCICMLSDLSSPADTDNLDIIVANLNKLGITLQFFLPFPLDKVGNQGDGKESYAVTPQQKEGLNVIQQILQDSDGLDSLDEVYSFRYVLEQLAFFKKLEKRPYPWQCCLTIGSNYSIPISAYKVVTEQTPRKTWTTVDAESELANDVKREQVYCLDDEDETEVKKDGLIQGYRYGRDIIPFAVADEQQLKYKTDGKCFSVLGFSTAAQIRRHHYLGNQVLQIAPRKDDEHAALALSTLIHALAELEKVAIMRYVYNAISMPRIGFAFPVSNDTQECLMFIQLPFAEDVRDCSFPSMRNSKKFTPTDEQLKAVDTLIDTMKLVEDDDENDDLFPVSTKTNPRFQRLFQCLQHKAFYPKKPLPPIMPRVLEMLEPPTKVIDASIPALKLLTKLFPLKPIIKCKEANRGQDVLQESDIPKRPLKKARLDNDWDKFNLEMLAEGDVTKVGTVEPAKDFCILVRQKELFTFQEVAQQLEGCVLRFLELDNSLYYAKTLDCLKAYRDEARKEKEHALYNAFLQNMKNSVKQKSLQDFWKLLVQDRISLLSKAEVQGSCVTMQESEEFLNLGEEPAEFKEEWAADDVDDLLDAM